MTSYKKPFSRLVDSISKIISEEKSPSGTKKSAQQKSHDDEIQNAILVLAADVIRCDRNFTEETAWLIQNFLTKHFGGARVKQRMKTIYVHIDTGTEPFTRMACTELKLLATHESLVQIVRFLFSVAGADDFVNVRESRRLQRIAGYLGIAEKEFKEIKFQFIDKHNPYTILGVEVDANWELVKRAYRKGILRAHPDKRPTGVSEQEARLKFYEVQRAFETIKKQLGITT